MKTKLAKILGALMVAFAINSTAFAAAITGAITFDGSVTLNTASAGTATAVDAWVNPSVGDADGDFASYVNNGDAVSFVAPWSFNTGSTINSFWSVGGFTFNLLSSSVIFQTTLGTGFVSVGGYGEVSGNGFEVTSGTWGFTTQGPAANGSFSFSASTGAVPDGGMTALLVGFGLLSMGLLRYRRQSV